MTYQHYSTEKLFKAYKRHLRKWIYYCNQGFEGLAKDERETLRKIKGILAERGIDVP